MAHTASPQRRMRTRRWLVVLATAVTAVTTATVAVTPSAAAPTTEPAKTCTPYKIVAVPGTGETNSAADGSAVGMLKDIPTLASRDAGSGVLSAEFVGYAATAFVGGAAYATSEADGVSKTKALLSSITGRCSATTFFLLGYSQGADVAGDVANDIGQGKGPIPATKLAGTVLISDPQRGTTGETVVGPNPEGNGIAGPRDTPFTGTQVATICDSAPDLYCATPKNQTLLSGIGKVLSTTTLSADGKDGTIKADSNDTALTAGLASLDVDGLTKAVTSLTQAAQTGNVTGAKTAITELTSKVSNLSNVSSLIDKSSAAPTLKEFPSSSPQNQASAVLGSIKNVDIANLSTVITNLANVGASVGLDSVPSLLSNLITTIAPLNGIANSDVTAATNIVSSIMPVSLLRQAATFADNLSRIDLSGMLTDLTTLFNYAVAGRWTEMPDVVNGLTQKLVGVVKTIDDIDLTPLVTILSLIPTPEAQIAGLVIKVINNLDLTTMAQRLADILKYLMAGNFLAVPAQVLKLFTTGVESSGLLGKVDLSAISKIADGLSPSTVMTAATDAVNFYSGGSHQNYGNLVVDSEGRTALQWTASWFASLTKK